MKVKCNPKTGSVVIVMSAQEAMVWANKLVWAAIASGAAEDEKQPEPTGEEEPRG